MKMTITVKKKNIHSKILFEKVDEHVRESVLLLDILSGMEDISSLIEMFLIDESDHHKLEQINVIADGRNNNFSAIKNGKIIIDIYYKHFNCFNVTQLTYILQCGKHGNV